MQQKAKKKFGQNFIHDKNLIKKIVNSAEINNQNVIEIGPGKGALTAEILKTSNSLTSYEIDQELIDYLEPLQAKYSNFNLIFKDILEVDLDNELPFNNYILVANLPYNITTPIIFKFLATTKLTKAIIMIQKEVAERLSAHSNTKQYNALSVILQYQTNVSKLFNVSPKMFKPEPKVYSTVVKIQKVNKYNLTKLEEEKFLKIVEASFIQKRKTLVNNLASFFNISKEKLIAFLSSLNYKENIRAEELTIDDFLLISREWNLW